MNNPRVHAPEITSRKLQEFLHDTDSSIIWDEVEKHYPNLNFATATMTKFIQFKTEADMALYHLMFDLLPDYAITTSGWRKIECERHPNGT